jgi:hypothetical protein
MSSVATGIGKAFTAVASTATKVGSAVAGVGTSLFTAGAASGAGSMASGGLSGVASSFGKSTLGNVLSGAIRTAGFGALAGGVVGAATGQGFMKGALIGAAGGGIMGGISGAMAPTGGVMATGGVPGATTGSVPASTATGFAPTGQTGGGGLMSFLNSEGGAGLVAGLGEGLMEWQKMKAQQDEYDNQRNFTREQQQRVTDSYKIDEGTLPGSGVRYGFNAATGRIERV